MKSNALVFGRRPEFELASVSHGKKCALPKGGLPPPYTPGPWWDHGKPKRGARSSQENCGA